MNSCQQFPALVVVQVDDGYAILAQPVDAAGKSAALAHDHRADAELAHQPAAIPARRQSGDHDHVAVTALAAGAAEGVGFAVNAGIAFLHAAVAAAADQVPHLA